MTSTDMTITGAAGAAPTPAAVVRPSSRDAVVLLAPTAAPFQGTGLPCTAVPAVARPWAPSPAGGRFAAEHRTDRVGDATRDADHAQRTTSSTPGAQPPRGLLS
jgi:hypothetical protein